MLARLSHPRCAEVNPDGLSMRGHRDVVVCPGGEASTSLRHEGWHLAQSLCLVAGAPWLEAATLEAQLNPRACRKLQRLVRAGWLPFGQTGDPGQTGFQ